MAPLAARLARGEARTAAVYLAFEVGSLILGISFVVIAVVTPLGGVSGKAIWALIGALVSGISVTVRGLHREALLSASRWEGVAEVYTGPGLSKETAERLDAIVFEYLEKEVRDGGRSRSPGRSRTRAS